MAQTFADWELVLWDDCSTDNSAEIIAEYRDPANPLLPIAGRYASR